MSLRKVRNGKLALLLVLTMLATLFVAVPAASAAATYSAGTLVKASAGADQSLGSVKVSVPAADIDTSQYVIMRLPSDFKFNLTPGSGNTLNQIGTSDFFSVGTDTDVQIRIPTVKNAAYAPGDYGEDAITVDVLSDNEIKINVTNALVKNTNEETAYFYVVLSNVWVASGFSGDVTVSIEGSSGSPFVDGTVVVATVGSGITKLSVDSVKTITTSLSDVDAIRLKEDRPGAFAKNQTIKLKLPNGFAWSTGSASQTKIEGPSSLTGDFVNITTDDSRTLVLTSKTTTSGVAAYYRISGLKVTIEDETLAKTGDVTVNVSGTATSSPDSFVIAKYGEYSAKAYAVGEPKVVLAGRTGAVSDTYVEIGKIAIEEAIKGSLIKDRTITFTLTGGAKWASSSGYVKDVAIDTSESKNYSGVLNTSWAIIGNEGDVARLTVQGTSSDAAKVVFKNAKISVPANASGDIKLIVGGTAGVEAEGDLLVAKIQAPVTVALDGNAPDLVIGKSVTLPDILVKETVKEAIDSKTNYNQLVLEFPDGIVPSAPSKVTVEQGDLSINPDTVAVFMNTNNNRWGIKVTIKSSSSTPSTLRFSGIKLTADRTVPEGAVLVRVKGSAVVQNASSPNEDFPGATTAASTICANCVTPAPGVTKGTAVFTLGQASYTLNGQTVSMPVAPYAKNGRTYLPLRFCGNAIGIDDANIWWDGATKTATLKKDNTIVQVKLGSQALYVNGVQVATMDVAPEAKDGYTMLPIRPVLEAFGAKVTYDAATQAISIEY